MKNYRELQETCIRQVIEAGITPASDITWVINYRSKRRWGQCTKDKKGKCTIEIAYQLLADDRISEKACRETIVHEILHSCKECNGHRGKWKEYAARMNALYGYNIKRITSGEEKGVENYKAKPLPVKYTFVCRHCGRRVRRKKACKFTRYYRNYTCGYCGTQRAFVKV